jgi:hypothetical protein
MRISFASFTILCLFLLGSLSFAKDIESPIVRKFEKNFWPNFLKFLMAEEIPEEYQLIIEELKESFLGSLWRGAAV